MLSGGISAKLGIGDCSRNVHTGEGIQLNIIFCLRILGDFMLFLDTDAGFVGGKGKNIIYLGHALGIGMSVCNAINQHVLLSSAQHRYGNSKKRIHFTDVKP